MKLNLVCCFLILGSCSTASRREPAATPTQFDGTYALAALRCGTHQDLTQIEADLFALRAAQRARGATEIETGHSRVIAGSGFALTIGAGRFTSLVTMPCRTSSLGEIDVRGDDALMTKTSALNCAGETLSLAERPDLNVTRLHFAGEYLVESTSTKCTDGRDFQRVWSQAESY